MLIDMRLFDSFQKIEQFCPLVLIKQVKFMGRCNSEKFPIAIIFFFGPLFACPATLGAYAQYVFVPNNS